MPIQERRGNKSRWISTIIMGALLGFGIWNSTQGEGSFISFNLDLGGVISVLIAEFRNELDNLLICEEFYPITTRYLLKTFTLRTMYPLGSDRFCKQSWSLLSALVNIFYIRLILFNLLVQKMQLIYALEKVLCHLK